MNSFTLRVLITVGVVISITSWIFTLLRLDPTSGLAVVLFYLNFSLALLGGLFLLDIAIAQRALRQSASQRVGVALRHSILLTVMIVLWTVLLHWSLARWWNIFLLIIILSLIESFFVAGERQSSTDARTA